MPDITGDRDLSYDEGRDINRALWDERVATHVDSEMYDLPAYERDPDYLSWTVAYDRPYLPDLGGRTVLHLQCHIGTDTVSLARLGASEVVGYDFSQPALDAAAALADRIGVASRWVQGDLYDAPTVLGGEQFDVVYTGIGALCWLPDIDRWAEVVATCLKPGGHFYIREGHPMMWSLDDERSPELVLRYPYFATGRAQVWDEDGTYAAEDANFANTSSVDWSHGLFEVVNALLKAGLVLEECGEHDVVDWKPFDVFQPSDRHRQMYELPEEARHLSPLTYHLRCRKPS